MTDKIATAYAGFLGRVDAILDTRGYALESQDVDYGWHQAFVIGQEPSDAVDEAMRSRPPACPWCLLPIHAHSCLPQRQAMLLSAHATAWWRDIEATDFVEQVNATYAAYLEGGGTDAHYDAHWRAFSDAAKEALEKYYALYGALPAIGK